MNRFINLLALFLICITVSLAQDEQAATADTTSTTDTEASKKAFFIWINSDPVGAELRINGQLKGKTPLLLREMKKGTYDILLSKYGYEKQQLSCEVPNTGEEKKVSLKLAAGFSLVTSEPAGASVYHGNQLLGVTPLILGQDELPYGDQELKLYKVAHESTRFTLNHRQDAAATHHEKLQSRYGELSLTVMPHDATLYIDTTKYGSLKKSPDSRESAVRPPMKFLAGKYRLHLVYHNEKSIPVDILIKPNETLTLKLEMWFPDLELVLKNGKRVSGMCLQDDEKAVQLWLKSRKIVTISADTISERVKIPLDQAREIVKKDRVSRKMKRLLEKAEEK